MKELVEEKQQLKRQLEAVQRRIEEVDDLIFEKVRDRVKPEGSTTLEQDGVKLTVTIPKVVSWDETRLRAIADKIKDSGDDPEQYIKYKLSVAESSFKAWPEQLQKVFLPARTTKPGRMKVEVKDGV